MGKQVALEFGFEAAITQIINFFSNTVTFNICNSRNCVHVHITFLVNLLEICKTRRLK